MAIPASVIVSINPRVISAGSSDLEINGLLLTKNELIPTSTMALEFTSPETVGDYFGYSSDEYTFANQYFQGYDNSFSKPTRLMIGRRVSEESTHAWLQGGPYTGTLEDLQAVTNGGFTINIDGTNLILNNVDLSSATSYSDVAQIITDKWVATFPFDYTVTYSSLTAAFTITSESTGSTSTITYASAPGEQSDTNLAELLMWQEGQGGTLSQGVDGMTVAENFQAIRTTTDNWVTFTTLWEVNNDEALEYAQWADSMGVNYLYVPWSTDANLLSQTDTTSIAITLGEAEVGATAIVYGTALYAAFIMGTAASVDWDRTNGVITYAFKSGITANVTSEADADVLSSKNVNYVGQFATRNDNFTFLYDGCMLGDYSFIDPYINAVWLNNALQVSLMDGLTQSPRTPYNDAGYTLIRAWMMDPVNRAVKNGVIDAGVELSESQKAELYREAGGDISEELYANGYVIQIEDPGASARVNRDSPTISLWYTYGGSVHRLEVASTAVL